MKQFQPILQKINKQLNLPQPEKSRILLEIAMDLEDIFNFYRENGMGEQEALEKAEEKISFSEETVGEMVAVHNSLFTRLANRISERSRIFWEMGLLFLVTIFVSYFTVTLIFQTPFFKEASMMIIPTLIVFLAILILAVVKFYQLFLKKDHRIKMLNTLMSVLFFLITLNFFLGMFGYVVELFIYSGQGLMVMNFLLLTLTVQTPESLKFVTETAEAILKSSSIALFSIFVTMIASSIWFLLNHKIMKIQQAEASLLLES